MITDITVENYRLFEKLEVKGMTRVTLLVGQNNSGKSSLLEAIYLLVNGIGAHFALFDILNQRGEFADDFDNRSRYFKIRHLFRDHKLAKESQVKISATGSRSYGTLTIDTSKAGGERLANVTGPRGAALKVKYADKTIIVLTFNDELDVFELDANQNIRMEYGLTYFDSDLEHRFVTPFNFNVDDLSTLWDNIILTSKEDSILEAIQILEPNIQRLGFTGRRETPSDIIVKTKNYDSPLPISSMGGGMRQILTVAIALANCEGGTLLVDDIDTGLHHTALTNMWKVVIETAKKLDVQVFATTHNWDCVASLHEALKELGDDESGSMFRLDKQDNLTWVVPYDRRTLGIAVEHNVEVR